MTRRIVIADDLPTNRIVLKSKLSNAFYTVTIATNRSETLRQTQLLRPDLILVNPSMRDLDQPHFFRSLKGGLPADLAPVILAFPLNNRDDLITALAAGADDALMQPVEDRVLLARIRNLLRARDRMRAGVQGTPEFDGLGFSETATGFERPPRIALVSPKPDCAIRWRQAMAPHLAAEYAVVSREQALDPGGMAPDLYILAGESVAPELMLNFLSDLRSRPATRDSAVCLVLPGSEVPILATALDMGADDILTPDTTGTEAALRARILVARKRIEDRQRKRVSEGLRLAIFDPLTGLHNRRFAMPRLSRMLAEQHDSQRLCAVLVLDLDRFKQVNDNHGHAAGDAVLVEVADRLRSKLRPGDLVARLGGEEFLVALPDCSAAEADDMAETLRRAVSDHPVTAGPQLQLPLTISIGMILCDSESDMAEAVIDRADRALMSAKAKGRNQVSIARHHVA